MFGRRAHNKSSEKELVSYEPKPVPRDLLSYKEMGIEMNRMAVTSVSWSSLLALVLVMLFCCFGSVAVNLLFSILAS